jgi:hypothetical protein
VVLRPYRSGLCAPSVTPPGAEAGHDGTDAADDPGAADVPDGSVPIRARQTQASEPRDVLRSRLSTHRGRHGGRIVASHLLPGGLIFASSSPATVVQVNGCKRSL